jgi:predicted DNA-binding ribbon-helix-helix protein
MTSAEQGRLRKRSVTIAGHRTSLSLEAAFWDALKEIATARGLSLNRLIEEIDRRRQEQAQEQTAADAAPNLSSAARVFVLGWLRGSGRF